MNTDEFYFVIGRSLGQGTFGKVRVAEVPSVKGEDGQSAHIAIKIMKKTEVIRLKQVRPAALHTLLLLYGCFYRTACTRCFPTMRLRMGIGILRIWLNSFTNGVPPPCDGTRPSLATKAAVLPRCSRIWASVGRGYTRVLPAVCGNASLGSPVKAVMGLVMGTLLPA